MLVYQLMAMALFIIVIMAALMVLSDRGEDFTNNSVGIGHGKGWNSKHDAQENFIKNGGQLEEMHHVDYWTYKNNER